MTLEKTVKALILVGGKSTRMAQDKATLTYHQLPQIEHVYKLLKQQFTEVYLSLREEQLSSYADYDFPTVLDIYPSIGPISGILSAFHHSPSSPWLVLAIDMPFITEESIAQLLSNFDSDKVATAFYNQEKNWAEPLLAIYSPKAYPLLLEYFQQDRKCPRKFLADKDLKLLSPSSSQELDNANTPEDFQKATLELKNRVHHD